MRTPIVLAIAFALLMLAGCKGSSIVGKWKGNANLSAEESKNPMAGMAAGMANAMTIEFKADNTFEMTMMLPITGTWTQSGNTITLTPKSVMGVDASKSGNTAQKPMILTLSPDGQTLTPQDGGQGPGGSFTFKRA